MGTPTSSPEPTGVLEEQTHPNSPKVTAVLVEGALENASHEREAEKLNLQEKLKQAASCSKSYSCDDDDD